MGLVSVVKTLGAVAAQNDKHSTAKVYISTCTISNNDDV